MTPHKYNLTSPRIKWAYLWEEHKPLQTSTCALFWRTVVLTPFKLLLPGAVFCFFTFIIGTGVLNQFHPEWLPESLRSAHEPTDWTAFRWVVGLAFGAFLLITALNKLGFFEWLHQFCLPVEIEGGLVRKGSCPQCIGMMVESDYDTSIWECRGCKGKFLMAPRES